MKRHSRISRGLFLTISIICVALPPPAVFADEQIVSTTVTTPAIVAPSSEPLVFTTPDLIMTAFATGDKLDMVELYNQSSVAIALDNVSIETRDNLGAQQVVPAPHGYLLAKHYITLAADTTMIQGALAFAVDQLPTSGMITELSLHRSASKVQSVNVPQNSGNLNVKDNYAWAQHKQRGNATLKQTGDFATDFTRKITTLMVEGTELYTSPDAADGLHIREIHVNPIDCEPTAQSALNLACGDYIKISNESDVAINLSHYRVRSGAFGDSASITNTYEWQQPTLTPEDEYMLEPHSFITIHLRDDLKPLALTATGKYVWLEDYFGTKTYESIQYPDMTLAKYTGLSWGYNAATASWEAAVPSPAQMENVFPVAPTIEDQPVASDPEFAPCAEGQYRSPETNRCRAIVLTVITPCKDGQYRSEETNRCRSIVQTVAASLKPCADDQFRNPATGRCRKIASSEDIIQPCDAGWERNLDTNRCRKLKVTDMPLAAFPVEPIAASTASLATWITAGSVLALAAGYAGWEWRSEVRGVIRRALPYLTRGK
jgi:hypothetical protein